MEVESTQQFASFTFVPLGSSPANCSTSPQSNTNVVIPLPIQSSTPNTNLPVAKSVSVVQAKPQLRKKAVVPEIVRAHEHATAELTIALSFFRKPRDEDSELHAVIVEEIYVD
eukprot:TRINITY_DN735_c0_g1_i1.p1 TRINITY_DN735_c0_g1~~TRINITY_DN735_c0_g1_i1.p1  ORF type:complete len:113 (+),score=1.57 TRINITY_DN735_c0_g1_i1:213-551(+)